MCNRQFHRKDSIKAKGFLDWNIFWRVKPFFKFAERIVFSGFGEPLLHPEFLSMLREIKRSGNFVYFFTNGVLLTERMANGIVQAGTDLICISMGGATRETYKKIRGIDAFETVVDNIRQIRELKKKAKKKKPHLSFNIVAMTSILPELESIVNLAHELNVETIYLPNLVVQGKSMERESLWHCPDKAEIILRQSADLAKRHKIGFFTPDLDSCRFNCQDLFRKMFIAWDGTVLSCAFERFIMGNVEEKNLDSIWNSEGMIKIRKDYHEKGLAEICPNCTCWDNRPETFLSPWINAREHAKRLG